MSTSVISVECLIYFQLFWFRNYAGIWSKSADSILFNRITIFYDYLVRDFVKDLSHLHTKRREKDIRHSKPQQPISPPSILLKTVEETVENYIRTYILELVLWHPYQTNKSHWDYLDGADRSNPRCIDDCQETINQTRTSL